ncbi:hypothetical protein Emag_005984 [Eimeria magna]
MMDVGSSERYLSISSLNPYVHRWQIKARVVDKSPLQTTKNNSKFFHVDVTDSAGDVIRAKFWGDAAEKWHGALEKGTPISSVTARSSGEELRRRVLKVRDKSQMEMEISLWGEQVDSITESAALPKVYGITGVNVRDWRGTRSGSSTKSSQVIAAGAGLLPPEDEAAAAELLQWYKMTGSGLSFLSMSRGGAGVEGSTTERKPVQELSIKEIKEKNEPGIYAFVAQVRRVYWKPRQQQQQQQQQQDIYAYPACPSCRKKLHEASSTDFSCYACNTNNPPLTFSLAAAAAAAAPEIAQKSNNCCLSLLADACQVAPDWRYMLLASFMDASGSLSCRCFADMGQTLLGLPAAEVRRWASEQKQHFFEWQSILKGFFRVTVKAELDNYNGEQRMRYTALRVEALDPHLLASLLLQQVKLAVSSAAAAAAAAAARAADVTTTAAAAFVAAVPVVPSATDFGETRKFKQQASGL